MSFTPKTWPLIPGDPRDDGELTPRQYTSLIRRASLRRYTCARADEIHREGKGILKGQTDKSESKKGLSGRLDTVRTRNSKHPKQSRNKQKDVQNQKVNGLTCVTNSTPTSSIKSCSARIRTQAEASLKVRADGFTENLVARNSRIAKPLKVLNHIRGSRKSDKSDINKQNERSGSKNITGNDQNKKSNKQNIKNRDYKDKIDNLSNKIKCQREKVISDEKKNQASKNELSNLKKRSGEPCKGIKEESRPEGKHKSQLYIQLSAGSHLSESEDARILRSSSASRSQVDEENNAKLSDNISKSSTNHGISKPQECQEEGKQTTELPESRITDTITECQVEEKHGKCSPITIINSLQKLTPNDSRLFDFTLSFQMTHAEMLDNRVTLPPLSSSSPASLIAPPSPVSHLPLSLPSSPVSSEFLSTQELSTPLTPADTSSRPDSQVVPHIPLISLPPDPICYKPSVSLSSFSSIPSLLVSSATLTSPSTPISVIATHSVQTSSSIPPAPPPRGKARAGVSKKEKLHLPQLPSPPHSASDCGRDEQSDVIPSATSSFIFPNPCLTTAQVQTPTSHSHSKNSSPLHPSISIEFPSSDPSKCSSASNVASKSTFPPLSLSFPSCSHTLSSFSSVTSNSVVSSTPLTPNTASTTSTSCASVTLALHSLAQVPAITTSSFAPSAQSATPSVHVNSSSSPSIVPLISSSPPPSLTSSSSSTTSTSVWSRYLSWLHRVTKTQG
ncbi:hypothetical protein Pmani_011156 [Petrolisthes manimaculis]|uniref:Uncharacterized protein n=1 Tax=Petrolisthes manimaculis TaxID=1843537 RepID=A0AAE1Q0N9_9EUCA|nr:hypothetical protein Pmani_011156 [Petrolisthes manimaculis]